MSNKESIEEYYKRMAQQRERNFTNPNDNLDRLDLNRIKQVDRHAKMYDRTKPVTNRDKGFRDILGEDGLPNKEWENAKPMSIEESERNYREAFTKQNSEKKEVFQDIYEEKKQKIFDHINGIVTQLQDIDEMFKKMK